jgi:Domain of unknown function (DUF4276)
MSRVYMLVEGPTDVAFLRRILTEKALRGTELVDAGGSSGIPSLARSVIVRRRCPVAVLMDSDSVDPDMIDERKQSTEDLIRAADASVPVKVVVVIPEIETWFLATPDAIGRILGQRPSEDWIALAKRDPKRSLTRLAEQNNRIWNSIQAIESLKTQDIKRIRALPEVAELSTFILGEHDRVEAQREHH